MILIDKFIINRSDISLPFSLGMVSRFIISNIQYDENIANLAERFNLNTKSKSKEKKCAYNMIKECLPYYYEEIRDTINGSPLITKRAARLVKVSNNNIYKVIEETDIVNLIHVLINDNVNIGIKLRLGSYVLLNEKGKIVRDFNSLPYSCSPTLEGFDEPAFKRKDYQLKFLSLLQIPNKPIYTIVEKSDILRGDDVLAYIFTISDRKGILNVVLESIAYNRATYLFQIRNEKFAQSVDIIKNYFSSSKLNKRSSFLSAKSIFSHENGFIQCSKLIHDNNDNWESRLIRVALGFIS